MARKLFDPLNFSREKYDEDPVIPVVDPGPDIDLTGKGNDAAENQAAQAGHAQANHAQAGSGQAKSAGASEIPVQAKDSGQCPNCAESDKARILALAEMENTRKRLAREKEEFMRYASESVITDILPALDNLDLALSYAPKDKESQNFVVGVDMTRKLLLDALARHGLQQVGALGEEFDPATHEAVGMEPRADYASGQICGLMTKGYKLKDRLLRPARVTVCKNEK